MIWFSVLTIIDVVILISSICLIVFSLLAEVPEDVHFFWQCVQISFRSLTD